MLFVCKYCPCKSSTVNDKSYAREQFCSLMGFVIMLGKLLQFCFYLYGFSLTAKSISRKTFVAIHQKSEKIVKVFSRVSFIIYGILQAN